MLLLNALINGPIVLKANLSDLYIERLKPLDEQAVHRDGRTCGRFRLAISERVALPPELMNDSVAPSIELGQFIYECRKQVVLLLKVGSILPDQVGEADILFLGDAKKKPQ